MGGFLSLSQYLSFLSFTLFIFAIPGPVVIFSLHNGINYGRNRALIASLGNVTALFILVILAASSLGLAAAASPQVLKLFQLVGAGYLFYLGFKMAFTRVSLAGNKGECEALIAWQTLYRRGFFMTLTNPKAFAYLVAVMPQFLSAEGHMAAQLIIMTPTIAASQLIVFGSYILCAERFRVWFLSAARIRMMNYIAGGILMLFGLLMAID